MPAFSLLIVDDDILFAESVREYLRRDAIAVEVAHSLSEAMVKLEARFPLVVLDHQLPDGAGVSLVPAIRAASEFARVVMVTGAPALDNAIDALRAGIDDYLVKPVELEALRLAVLRTQGSLEQARVAAVERWRRQRLQTHREFVTGGAWFERNRQLLERAAQSAFPIVLKGETGTGKTLLARHLHALSVRANGPFLSLNCASLPESLVESELFGHERGAFTGATQSKEGLFELADGGTLLLDEIGEMTLSAQAKLLSVLEDGLVRRVGATGVRQVDVRVIAATHVDLQSAGAKGSFREDLRYRLEVVSLEVAPLRERLDELEGLVEHWLRKLRPQRTCHLADGELDRLKRYAWPGNLRELRNVLERTLLLEDGSTVFPSQHLPRARAAQPPPAQPQLPLSALEKHHILEALSAAHGSRQKTAADLGISIATLRRKLKAYKITAE